MPKFVLKDMEGLFIEELNLAVNTLKGNLESLPVQQGDKGGKGSNPLTKGIGKMKPRSEMSFAFCAA